MNIAALVRENVLRLQPFSSAREEYTGAAEVLLDANESPYESDCNRYPDPYQKELKEILAQIKGVTKEQIILGNGSDELIDLIVRTFCRPTTDKMRFIYPSFGMYEVIADINDVQKEAVMLDNLFDLDVSACLKDQTDRDKILFLCSPNNPTGNILSRDRIIAVIEGWRGIVVLDEAYHEFCPQESLLELLHNYPNLIILQTFSKAMGAAGLRLGIGFSSSEVIQYLNKIKPPYNINVHTQQRAKVLLSQLDIVKQRLTTLIKERERVADILNNTSGVIQVFPSQSNFLLIKCTDHLLLYRFLIDRGVIVRDRSRLERCESCLRITIGLPKENELLLELIQSFYTK